MYWTSLGILSGGNTTLVSTTWTDGTSIFRLQVRGIYLNLDQTKTPTGFDGTIGNDWDVIRSSRY